MRDAIIHALPPHFPWTELLHVFDVLDSTNTHAQQLAQEGARSGTIVMARQQTAGRGRMGRSFLSPKDSGLYLSVILRPNCLPGALMHLTCATAVAVCDGIEALTGVRPGIKWINDLVMNRRKIAGILTQLGFTAEGRVDYAIIGIGINLSQRQEDFPTELQGIAGSLRMFTPSPPSLPHLAAAVMVALEKMSGQLLTHRDPIMEQYRRDCITLGAMVRVISSEGTREGCAREVLSDGSLSVEFSDGHRENVSAGEVSVRGLWDYL